EGPAQNALEQGPRVFFLGEAVAGELEGDVAVPRQQLPERLGLEVADLVVAADDHRQDGGLHAAAAPQGAAGAMTDRVVSGRVEADDPVRLAAAPRRGIEVVVLGEGTQAAERVADRRLGQRAQPQPARRLARAADELLDVAEDQLTLAAGVR